MVSDSKTQAISDFFRDLTSGHYDTKGLCFSNWVLKERRQHLLNAIQPGEGGDCEEEDERRVKGRSIMNAMKQMESEEAIARHEREEALEKEAATVKDYE